MICVVEYGEHIGTLRNLFPWYCQEKKEYVKIEGMGN
jgi:hypothetical protein